MKQGDRVRHTGNPEYGFGTIKLIDSDPLDEEEVIHVAFDWLGGTTACPPSSLQLVTKFTATGSIPPNHLGTLRELQARLGAGLILSEHSQTAGFSRSFITPLPHQAYLLEKIHAHRHYGHLIADDVGMGKTIEAGLIIAAERQINPDLRVLVIAPKNVLLQWQDEMDDHFGLHFRIAKHDFSIDKPQHWEGLNLVIASRDGLKQEGYRPVLKGIEPFDLIVIDEAHGLTAKREFFSGDLETTANFRFARWLSENHVVTWEDDGQGAPRSPRFLFLSATPHQGDDFRFLNLLNLVRPDLIEPEDENGQTTIPDLETLNACVSRTPKSRAVDWDGKSIFKGHDSRTVEIELTAPESHVLRLLTWYVNERMVFNTTGRGDALVRALAMHSYQKIATSSWKALESALVARMSGRIANDADEDEALTEFGLLGGEREIEAIQQVLALIRVLDRDTKAAEFRRLLEPSFGFRAEGEKVLVFTQYRVTQLMLKKLVESLGLKVAMINGSLGIEERKSQRAYFEDTADVMISTEAGSEGANLQRKCHLLINYDSPWNPMRLLQRVGRLDRYGQKHRVKGVTLRTANTWDTQISQRINERLQVIQRTMGQLADEDYWDMVIGEVYDGLDAGVLLAAAGGDPDSQAVKMAIDAQIERVRIDQNRLKQLLSKSLGMPEGFENQRSVLGPDEFKLAFTWAAAAEQVKLQRAKTDRGQLLPGVFHFTLPTLFRQLLRASREFYVVFDRERFAEVRNEVIGRARGQEIRPTLAGLGEPVTDWFFTRAVTAATDTTCYALEAPLDGSLAGSYWIVFIARWKRGSIGPNYLKLIEIDSSGTPIRDLLPSMVFGVLDKARASDHPESIRLPDLSQARLAVQAELREALSKMPSMDRSNLRFEPWLLIAWQ